MCVVWFVCLRGVLWLCVWCVCGVYVLGVGVCVVDVCVVCECVVWVGVCMCLW